MATRLEEVKRLALELTADERQKLLDYLKPISEPTTESTRNGGSHSRRKKSLAEYRQLKDELKSRQSATAGSGKVLSLEEAFALSDKLATQEDPNSETMTQAFLRTRR
jgi:hypothetical protein